MVVLCGVVVNVKLSDIVRLQRGTEHLCACHLSAYVQQPTPPIQVYPDLTLGSRLLIFRILCDVWEHISPV